MRALLRRFIAEKDAEVAKERAAREAAERERDQLRDRLTCICGELRKAIADKKRLDFLDECNERLNAHHGTIYTWELILNHSVNRLMLGPLAVDLTDQKAHGRRSCRDAIDREMTRIAAARAALQQQETLVTVEETSNG